MVALISIEFPPDVIAGIVLFTLFPLIYALNPFVPFI
jgi:hypothetical protein